MQLASLVNYETTNESFLMYTELAVSCALRSFVRSFASICSRSCAREAGDGTNEHYKQYACFLHVDDVYRKYPAYDELRACTPERPLTTDHMPPDISSPSFRRREIHE